MSSRSSPGTYDSGGERILLEMIEEMIGEELTYSCKTTQYGLWSPYLNRLVKYDIVDLGRKCVIEYHGDYWHMNPKFYDADSIHAHSKKNASDIWKIDYLKQKTILDQGFKLKIIWESDFNKDKVAMVRETVDWLKCNDIKNRKTTNK